MTIGRRITLEASCPGHLTPGQNKDEQKKHVLGFLKTCTVQPKKVNSETPSAYNFQLNASKIYCTESVITVSSSKKQHGDGGRAVVPAEPAVIPAGSPQASAQLLLTLLRLLLPRQGPAQLAQEGGLVLLCLVGLARGGGARGGHLPSRCHRSVAPGPDCGQGEGSAVTEVPAGQLSPTATGRGCDELRYQPPMKAAEEAGDAGGWPRPSAQLKALTWRSLGPDGINQTRSPHAPHPSFHRLAVSLFIVCCPRYCFAQNPDPL
ncbi:hypothetical protein NDU88_005941 [Pleurodeles waltl]|uniref:Uncharacterized protein n=1 Tax=Pleurodeles waltl TaxID=8319 RepID=A0AAV7SN20_PLEWA|nr:hypothetical protein NDU88_005941 [Pleurodeles waltl]